MIHIELANWNGLPKRAIAIITLCRFVLLIHNFKGYNISNRKSCHITVCVVHYYCHASIVTDFIDFYKVGSSFLKVTLLIYGIWNMHSQHERVSGQRQLRLVWRWTSFSIVILWHNTCYRIMNSTRLQPHFEDNAIAIGLNQNFTSQYFFSSIFSLQESQPSGRTPTSPGWQRDRPGQSLRRSPSWLTTSRPNRTWDWHP